MMMEMTTNTFSQINTTSTPDGNGSVNIAELKHSLSIACLVFLSLVFVLGVLGNGVVIWVTGFKMKKTVNTVWYLNLAVADIIFTAFLPFKVTSLALGSHWPFGKFMCKLDTTLLLLNLFTSVYILVVISVDRCVSVVWPIWAHNHRNIRNASCVSLCIWVVAVSITAPFYLTVDTRWSVDKIICSDTLFDIKSPSQFHLQAIVIAYFLLGFVVPFTVIVSCYAVKIHRLRRNRILASQSHHSFEIITAIIITFFLCWAPAYIMNLIRLVMADSNIIITGSRLANCLAAVNSCVNPLLYVFIRQDFKDQVRKSLLNVLRQPSRKRRNALPVMTRRSKQSFEYSGIRVFIKKQIHKF